MHDELGFGTKDRPLSTVPCLSFYFGNSFRCPESRSTNLRGSRGLAFLFNMPKSSNQESLDDSPYTHLDLSTCLFSFRRLECFTENVRKSKEDGLVMSWEALATY